MRNAHRRFAVLAAHMAGPVLALGLAPFTPAIAAQPLAAGPVAARPLDVWIMDVGQGACIYVDCPNATAGMLVDCGTNSAGPRTDVDDVGSWIDGRLGRKSFNTVVISHPHTDHYSEISGGLIRSSRASQVFLGGLRSQYAGSSSLDKIDAWLDQVPAHDSAVHAYAPKTFIAGDTSFKCAPATVDVLTATVSQDSPANGFESRENANSVVLRVSYGGQSILLPGDAERITQDSALANARANGLALDRPTVVVGSHHGSSTHGSNEASWRAAWKAPVAIFSAQINYRHRHPKCETVQGYGTFAQPTASGFKLWCGGAEGGSRQQITVSKRLLSTYENGHLLVRFDGVGMKIYCQAPSPACDGPLDATALPPLRRP